MNFTTPSQQQQHQLTNEQWTNSNIPLNHLSMQIQHQPSCAINNIPSIPIQHQQSINNK